jgi:hypothetical protein
VSGLLGLLLRSRSSMPEWPRRRQGALKDERRWIEQLNDRELAQLASDLHAVDKAVKNVEKAKKDAA